MAANSQRNYFSPDVFFPLPSVVAASYKVNNSIKFVPISLNDKLLRRIDRDITFKFDPNENQIEVFLTKAKVVQWLNNLIRTPEKVQSRQFYLLINISPTEPYTNRYVNNKPLVSVVIMSEV